MSKVDKNFISKEDSYVKAFMAERFNLEMQFYLINETSSASDYAPSDLRTFDLQDRCL